MNRSFSITWFEWFDDSRKDLFKKDTKELWNLALRNSIGPTIFKKWLRETICSCIPNEEINTEELVIYEKQWALQKGITFEKFRSNKLDILYKFKISEENFRLYCLNEAKAAHWANTKWSESVDQIYLETKDDYDQVKLKIVTLPGEEKGLVLEAYQRLKEDETKFENLAELSQLIRYQSNPSGSWYKRNNLRKEIYQTVKKLSTGKISKPFKIDDKYTILEFCDMRGVELDTDIKNKIVISQMNKFIDYGVGQLMKLAYEESKG